MDKEIVPNWGLGQARHSVILSSTSTTWSNWKEIWNRYPSAIGWSSSGFLLEFIETNICTYVLNVTLIGKIMHDYVWVQSIICRSTSKFLRNFTRKLRTTKYLISKRKMIYDLTITITSIQCMISTYSNL